MKVSEITKDWKTFSSFIIDNVTGADKAKFTEEEWAEIDAASVNIIKDLGIDEIAPKAKKLMNLNIVDENVSFDIFEKLPTAWSVIYPTAGVIAAERGE